MCVSASSVPICADAAFDEDDITATKTTASYQRLENYMVRLGVHGNDSSFCGTNTYRTMILNESNFL